ncbi:MAG: hypothetical protein JEZ12_21430 [Desulfobacterium sp.]|nr:hypothetical protein [Desulfobacterium sp.]
MGYINHAKLIQTIVEQRPFDSKDLLSDLNPNNIIKALERSKGGLPQPINVTSEPNEEENLAQVPARDKERLMSLCSQLKLRPLELLPELKAMQARYPNVPTISNYIGITYIASGQEDLYLSTLWETRERFPDYLFGKISLAEYYLNNQNHQQIPHALGRKLELGQHRPAGEAFHISEVRAFFSMIGIYFARTNKITRALFHYCVLADLDHDHPVTQRLGDEIIYKEVAKLKKRFAKSL